MNPNLRQNTCRCSLLFWLCTYYLVVLIFFEQEDSTITKINKLYCLCFHASPSFSSHGMMCRPWEEYRSSTKSYYSFHQCKILFSSGYSGSAAWVPNFANTFWGEEVWLSVTLSSGVSRVKILSWASFSLFQKPSQISLSNEIISL